MTRFNCLKISEPSATRGRGAAAVLRGAGGDVALAAHRGADVSSLRTLQHSLPILKRNLPLTVGVGPLLGIKENCCGLPVGLLKGTVAGLRKATASEKRKARAMRALADKYDKRIKAAFLRSIRALKKTVDVTALTNLISTGKLVEALDLMHALVNDASLKAITTEFNNAVTEGAKLSAKFGHEDLHGDKAHTAIEFVFDVANPKTVGFLQRYAGEKITGLTRETHKVVRDTLERGFAAGRNGISVARDIRGMIGLTEGQQAAVLNFRSILEDGVTTSGREASFADYAARELRDARYDSTVRTAFESGDRLSQDRIDAMVDRYQENTLNYRADTIGRTEGMAGVSAGNLEVWNQAAEEGMIQAGEVRRYWVYTDDEKVRDSHAAIPDMNPEGVGLDEPFASPLGDIMFPGDPGADPANSINCRCVVIYQLEPKE